MSSAISACNYEFQGQVYSPAFSEPPSPPQSPMSTSSDTEQEAPQQFVNRRPKFPTKYHEMLQPINPITTLHVETRTKSIVPTHKSKVNAELQQQFLNILQLSEASDIELFLREHSENIDVNQYNCDGQTPLHIACIGGNCDIVKILIRFGADPSLTNRDGFSVLHLASFSGSSEVLTFLTNLRRR